MKMGEKTPNNFTGFQTWGCLLNEDRTCRFIILFYVNILSTLWHYVWRLVFVQPMKQLESENKKNSYHSDSTLERKNAMPQTLKYFAQKKLYMECMQLSKL